jgi:hypothetical protein
MNSIPALKKSQRGIPSETFGDPGRVPVWIAARLDLITAVFEGREFAFQGKFRGRLGEQCAER